MNGKFEIAGKSVKDPAKQRNGDSFRYAVSAQGLVLLSLADGIGSRNCDWLASDGCYNCQPTFDVDIQNAIESPDIEKQLDKIFFSYADYQSDDATVLILRRTDLDPVLRGRYKDSTNYEELKRLIPKSLLLILFLDELHQKIVRKDKEGCFRILEIMNIDAILPSKQQLDSLISACKANNFLDGGIYTKIVGLMRRSL